MRNRDAANAKESEEGIKAYEQISRLTGLRLDNKIAGHCYGLVIDRKHERFRQVGVFHYSDYPYEYYKFGKRVERFHKSQIYSAINVKMILVEREKLFKLF